MIIIKKIYLIIIKLIRTDIYNFLQEFCKDINGDTIFPLSGLANKETVHAMKMAFSIFKIDMVLEMTTTYGYGLDVFTHSFMVLVLIIIKQYIII